MAGKYDPLHRYLRSLAGNEWLASFSEIEGILGFALPASAHRHRPWWSNSSEGTHSHARAWVSAGWRVDSVDLQGKRITFARRNFQRQIVAKSDARNGTSEKSERLEGPSPTYHFGEYTQDQPVALISCVKSKRNHPVPAKDLYISALFEKSRALVEAKGWKWFVLSALYGLVEPDAVIAPYEKTLNRMPRIERSTWARKVLQDIFRAIPPKATLVLLAGERYVMDLVPELRFRGYAIIEPLKGLTMGYRLSALDRMIESEREIGFDDPRMRQRRPAMQTSDSVFPPRASPQLLPGDRPFDGDRSTNRLKVDIARARELAKRLYEAFLLDGPGIYGAHEMPEDILPAGMNAGSREHLLFLTLSVSVDYMRDADALWKSSGRAWKDPETKYLFEPEAVIRELRSKVVSDLRKVGISLRPNRDGHAWVTIAGALAAKWQGDPRNFLISCDYHASTVLRRLSEDWHEDENGKLQPDFPLLRGPKIGPLWVRMLRDNAGVELKGLSDVPIPVDIHVLRATLCTGILRGDYSGPLSPLYRRIRQTWKDACTGVQAADGKLLVALDVDEALWTLSRRGCSLRGNGRLRACPACPASPGCVEGYVKIDTNTCDVRT